MFKLGIGGFSMGAATALYSAICFAQEKYGNGNTYTVNLRAIIGLSGRLPGSRNMWNKTEGSLEAARRASSLPILRLVHYTVPREMDEVCNWLSARLGLEGCR